MNFSYGLLSYKSDYKVRRDNEKLSLMLREIPYWFYCPKISEHFLF